MCDRGFLALSNDMGSALSDSDGRRYGRQKR